MVNIIMPAYNAHETIRQAVASVAMQDNLNNILLTIIDDCSDNTYDYLKNDFNYMNIEILRKPSNTGCGQSRQWGIDRCTCKYFMFLDTDDCLYSPNAVKKIYSYMEEQQLDFLYSDFLEELSSGEYLLHENDGVWMHGKIFRTDYIKYLNVRFNMTRVNEDHAFNIIANLAGGKNLYIDYVTYVWKYNSNSITRSCDSRAEHLEEFIINSAYTISELQRLDISEEQISDMVIKYIITLYGYYNLFIHQGKSEKFLKQCINLIRDLYNEFPAYIRNKFTKNNIKENFYDNTMIQMLLENNVLFAITFEDYYKLIQNYKNISSKRIESVI